MSINTNHKIQVYFNDLEFAMLERLKTERGYRVGEFFRHILKKTYQKEFGDESPVQNEQPVTAVNQI